MRKVVLIVAGCAVAIGAWQLPTLAAPLRDVTLHGAVQNRVPQQAAPKDTRNVSVQAGREDGLVEGTLTFRHYRHQPASEDDGAGLSKFRATVECLQVDDAVVRVNGLVLSGSTSTGVDLSGAAFAMEFNLDDQVFTLPAFGGARVDDGGACLTSGRERVAITSGALFTDG